MKTKASNPASSTQNDQIVHFMLKALEVRVGELKDNIDVSRDMLPLGIDTDLTSKIKQTIADPITQLMTVRNDVDGVIKSFILSEVQKFLLSYRHIIKKAFQTETGREDLHFSIILKEDNTENRSTIFTFLREYKQTNLWEEYPVLFQFVPSQIEDKILAKQSII